MLENIKITINVSLKTVAITYNSNDENSLTSTQELEPYPLKYPFSKHVS